MVAGQLSRGHMGRGLKVWEEGLGLSMRAVGSYGVFRRERQRQILLFKRLE